LRLLFQALLRKKIAEPSVDISADPVIFALCDILNSDGL